MPPSNFAEIVSAFAAVVLGIAACALTIIVARNQEKTQLQALIDKMIDIALEYPYVERQSFCDKYPNGTVDDDIYAIDRYENYCVFVFNALTRIAAFCNYDMDEVRRFIAIEELLVLHHTWWKHDHSND